MNTLLNFCIIAATLLTGVAPAYSEAASVPCKEGYVYICNEVVCDCVKLTSREWRLPSPISPSDSPRNESFTNQASEDPVQRLVRSLRDVGASSEEILDVGTFLGIEEQEILIGLLLPAVQKVR